MKIKTQKKSGFKSTFSGLASSPSRWKRVKRSTACSKSLMSATREPTMVEVATMKAIRRWKAKSTISQWIIQDTIRKIRMPTLDKSLSSCMQSDRSYLNQISLNYDIIFKFMGLGGYWRKLEDIGGFRSWLTALTLSISIISEYLRILVIAKYSQI